jgi:phosphomannomutase
MVSLLYLAVNPNEPVTLTPAKMFHIGASFAEWLSKNRNTPLSSLKVSVGADPRLSSPMMSASLIAGIASKGVTVAQFGIATTPAMFMSCVMEGYNYDGAVMVTASHLPVNRNGAKFFTATGGLGKPDIKVILQRATELAIEGDMHASDKYNDPAYVVTNALKVSPELILNFDYLEVYAAHLRDIVKRGVDHPTAYDTPLSGFKVVVNAGNGAGGFFAEKVLGPLGADISGSIYLNPDGSFPNHPPNPEDKAAVKATTEAVLSSGADFGIMLDTDVDRSGVVDSSGIAINRNRYIALMASIALRENPNETIVTDSCTSNGLATFITQLGGRHFRYKKGYKNIIDKGMELNDSGVPCPLMMETSGHGAMRENFFLDDGAYSALKIVIEAVRRRLAGQGDISELLKELREPVEAMEIRVKIKAADITAEGAKVTAAFKEWMDNGAGGNKRWVLEDENYEGWRVKVDEGDGKEGWILVRPSLHDPDIVMNVESEQNGGMRQILLHFLEFFKAYPNDFDVCTGLVEDYVFNP